MKSIIFVMALTISSVSFADPFAAFVGSYGIKGTPRVSKSGPGSGWCSWQNFENIKSLTIFQKNGFYVGDQISTLNNSPLHSYTSFKEYNFSDSNGVSNTGKISGDAASATYVWMDTSQAGIAKATWTISKTINAFHLRMVSEDQFTCSYDVDLSKN